MEENAKSVASLVCGVPTYINKIIYFGEVSRIVFFTVTIFL